jgi:hypothetical protein
MFIPKFGNGPDSSETVYKAPFDETMTGCLRSDLKGDGTSGVKGLPGIPSQFRYSRLV